MLRPQHVGFIAAMASAAFKVLQNIFIKKVMQGNSFEFFEVRAAAMPSCTPSHTQPRHTRLLVHPYLILVSSCTTCTCCRPADPFLQRVGFADHLHPAGMPVLRLQQRRLDGLTQVRKHTHHTRIYINMSPFTGI